MEHRHASAKRPRPWLGLVAALSSILFWMAACGPGQARGDGDEAQAILHDRSGKQVGAVTLQDTPNGVLVRASLEGLPPGVHAFHIHEKGVCQPPFTSAGGHFNPTGKEHGFLNPRGPHAGDLPNIVVPASGQLKLEVLDPWVHVGHGEANLLDADGSSLVIHQGPDDYRTQPAGDAGERIACGVIEPKP